MELAVASMTIRNLDEKLKARLRVQAARHGRSMEAEVRAILQERLASRTEEHGLGSRIHARFADLDDGWDIPDRGSEPPRGAVFDQ